jgi:hypothetical protein
MHEGHHHDHEHQADSPEMREALLAYLLKHNRSHARELAELGDQLAEAGDAGAAEAVRAGAAFFEQGNAALERAVRLLEGT